MKKIKKFINNYKVNLIILIFIVTIFDLWTKYFIFNLIDVKLANKELLYPLIKVTNFFNLIKTWNNGVSFSMFSNLENAKYIFSIINLIVILILLLVIFIKDDKYQNLALSFIIAGAAGNMIDRIYNGAVADFLDFHINQYHWPAFNVADIAIFIGAFLLIFENFINKNDKKNN